MWCVPWAADQAWPQIVKKDFSAQVHKFMANLTEAVHQAKGHTILYVPHEELRDPRAAAADRDLVQRLESTVGAGTTMLQAC